MTAKQEGPAPIQGRARRVLHAVSCDTEVCDSSCPHVPVVRYRPETGQFEQLTPAGRWWPLQPVSRWQVDDPDLHD